MKQILQLKLSQNLALTPQLQQAIKLLQLSTLELDQELEKYLASNPLLEREDDDDYVPSNQADTPDSATHDTSANGESQGTPEESSWDTNQDQQEDSLSWDDFSSSGTRNQNDDDDDREYHETSATSTSLKEHLNWQLGLTPLDGLDQMLVHYLIESLNDSGYLTTSLEDILEEFANSSLDATDNPVTLDDLRIALRYLQSFDPIGVGARNTQECLTLQLSAKENDEAGIKILALTIVENHLSLLAARDFVGLKKATSCKEEQLRSAYELIQTLDPRPGSRFAPDDTRYIVPDVIVRKVRSNWTVTINPDAFPRLRVNQMYAQILQQQQSSSRLSEQLQEARWLIRNVQQRFETILLVSKAIVDQQRQFFDHGEVAMRPLVMREIADRVGLHESTISRVTTQKYMATPRGIYELKYFFASHVPTDTGGACSSTAIRAVIKQLVAAENSKKPLSDNKISELLGQQGIIVARRTVAKYRESMGIPPANLRKVL